MLTFKMPADGYTGAAYEGVGFLPWLGEKLTFILEPLFGFKSAEAIAFPITALGAVGGAISLVPEFLKSGLIGANDIAVFTAMGMLLLEWILKYTYRYDGCFRSKKIIFKSYNFTYNRRYSSWYNSPLLILIIRIEKYLINIY